MQSDIDIAQAAQFQPIVDIARKLHLLPEQLIPHGHFIAKIQQQTIQALQQQPAKAKLILVTAISPTPAGEGKTTTTIGLTDALNHINHHAIACLREPSLGPVFGMKGGATGGGYAQVVPMEAINLHFTGDFHAISSANNLLAALIDNHVHHGNALGFERITWRRCMDMNDRALRRLTVNQPFQYDTGFDITVASEVMAIFCLAKDLADLTAKLGEIQVGISQQGTPILAKNLQAEGAMTVLLKDAFQPNLVQTLAGSPALVHGGPFANIAHGCNSLVATNTALRLADYVVTEAGFGADLGAEKFIDIKCRLSGLRPDAAVIVATIRALKYHGGVDVADLNQENMSALQLGLQNLQRHLHNLHDEFGLPVVVALNHFTHDTEAEIALVKKQVTEWGYQVCLCQHWAQGAAGAVELAQAVVAISATTQAPSRFLYADDDSIEDKLHAIAQKLYGARGVALSPQAQAQLAQIAPYSIGMPVCVAKTQYSFSCDATLRNAPSEHVLQVRELRLSRGAGFVVAVCGDIMTMPGLPKQPTSVRVGVDTRGKITGLS